MTATTECSRCGGSGREPLPLPDGPSTIPCPGNDADPPGCDGAGVVPVESPIVDLMAALQQSIADTKAARDRHKTGSPVPTSDEHERTCMHYRSFGDRPCDCGTDTGRGEA